MELESSFTTLTEKDPFALLTLHLGELFFCLNGSSMASWAPPNLLRSVLMGRRSTLETEETESPVFRVEEDKETILVKAKEGGEETGECLMVVDLIRRRRLLGDINGGLIKCSGKSKDPGLELESNSLVK